MNPSPLTGERMANILEHRHTFFFINPNQRVLQFVPASGSYGDSGPHHNCGYAFQLRSARSTCAFLKPPETQKPALMAGFFLCYCSVRFNVPSLPQFKHFIAHSAT